MNKIFKAYMKGEDKRLFLIVFLQKKYKNNLKQHTIYELYVAISKCPRMIGNKAL